MAGETILSITYGLEVQPNDDPYDYIELAEQCHIPVTLTKLQFLNGFLEKKIKRWRDLGQAMIDRPFRAAKTSIDSGTSVPSFVKHYYDNTNEDDLIWPEYLIQGTAATLYTDTTVSSIAFCIMALLKHPDVLQRAQRKIDSVIPQGLMGELQTFQDEEKLPFVFSDSFGDNALERHGPNRVMLHNEEIYPDPFSFKSDRFLKDGKINNEGHPARAAFGLVGGKSKLTHSPWIFRLTEFAREDSWRTLQSGPR
ncbi:Cytochrome P450 [Amanita muscaria]